MKTIEPPASEVAPFSVALSEIVAPTLTVSSAVVVIDVGFLSTTKHSVVEFVWLPGRYFEPAAGVYSTRKQYVAMLAGVNEVFFSTFQLKHVGQLVKSFSASPPDLADRIDAALVAPMPAAAEELERLVEETMVIVERQLPEVDVSGARRRIGQRHQPWSIPK